jgi:hypothetical protein
MSDRLISTEKLKEALAKNRNYHALNAREVYLLNRTIQIVDEQPNGMTAVKNVKPYGYLRNMSDYENIVKKSQLEKGGAKCIIVYQIMMN